MNTDYVFEQCYHECIQRNQAVQISRGERENHFIQIMVINHPLKEIVQKMRVSLRNVEGENIFSSVPKEKQSVFIPFQICNCLYEAFKKCVRKNKPAETEMKYT